MADKQPFSAQWPCSITPEELEAKLRDVELDQVARALLTNLLIGGYGAGVATAYVDKVFPVVKEFVEKL